MASDAEARGLYVRGEVSTADASAGVTATLYDPNGVAVTLKSTQRLIIFDIVAVAATAGNLIVGAGSNAAGFRLLKGNVGANGGIAVDLQRPILLPKNVIPKLYAAVGQADLSFIAEILDT